MWISRSPTAVFVVPTFTPFEADGNRHCTLAALGEQFGLQTTISVTYSLDCSHEIIGHAVKVGSKAEGGIK